MPTQYPPIDLTLTAPLVTEEAAASWTVVRVVGSGAILGTNKAVKVGGTIDGHPFAATMLPLGGGTHILPVKAALRKTLGKEAGAEVTVHIDQRFS